MYRVHYASDLSFVHLPTLIDPYIHATHQNWGDNSEEDALKTTQSPPLDSSGVILAFLALTLRHCRNRVRECLMPHAHDLDSATVLSAYFAVLARRSLTINDADWLRSDVEGVQVRLMLATYDWSLGRSHQARQSLSEAISLAGEIGLLQDFRAKCESSSISVAMAFEAESMGIKMRSARGSPDPADHGAHAEAARRTTWSLFLMDTQYALGDHRVKLICYTNNFPPLPSSEAGFTGNTPTRLFPENERVTGWLGQQTPEALNLQLHLAPCYFAPTSSTELCPPLTPSVSSTSSNSLPDAADGRILSHYIRYLSLFHRIHEWARSKPWRFVSYASRFGLR